LPTLQPMNYGENSVSDAAADIFVVAGDNLDDLLSGYDTSTASRKHDFQCHWMIV